MLITDFTTLQVTGTKQAEFLHQLCTQSVSSQPEHDVYTAFLNNQGRVIFDAYLRFIDTHTAWIILPSSMLKHAQTHLSRYAAFSKVSLQALNHLWTAVHAQEDTISAMPYRLQQTVGDTAHVSTDAWLYEEISHGIPRIREGQQELFTAHMLNLNHLNALSFQKGCYLGQEITHRVEMLGQTKKGLYCGNTDHGEAWPLSVVRQPQPIGLYVVEHALAIQIPGLKRLFP